MTKKTMSRKIASYVYCQASLNTDNGSWIVYSNEIDKAINLPKGWEKDKKLLKLVYEELTHYEGLACEDFDTNIQIEDDSTAFDVIIYSDYASNNYDADTDF